MPIVRLNGTSLYYERQGSGTPIVFIHGYGFTHEMFKPQLACFAEHYQVISCDLRGNGKSGKLLQPPDQIIDTQCMDLILLLNELHIRAAVFVGVAYGGLLVQQLAWLYPERVRAIVIADSFCRTEVSTLAGKLQLAAAHSSWLSYYAPQELMMPSVRLLYRRWHLAYSEIRKNMRAKRPRELYLQRLATSRIDYSAHLAAIHRPALCLVGDFSEFSIQCMQELYALLPNAKFEMIPDAYEPSNLCQPEKFNDILKTFLEQINHTQVVIRSDPGQGVI